MRPEILNIHGLTTEDELEFLQSLCVDLPVGKVLEIGTFNGRSCAALCEAVGDARVVTVDSWRMQHHGENTQPVAASNLARLDMKPSMLTITSPLAEVTLDLHLNPMAMFFLDGHHDPKTVRVELTEYHPRVGIGGIAALHDYGATEYPGYTEAIDQFFSEHQGWYKVGLVGSLVAFRREA